MRFEIVGKSYRKIAYAYEGDLSTEAIGHIGWCPAAVRQRRALKKEGLHPTNSAGTYRVFLYVPDRELGSRAVTVGESETLPGAKKLMGRAAA